MPQYQFDKITNFLDNFLVLLGFAFHTSSSSSSLVFFYYCYKRFLVSTDIFFPFVLTNLSWCIHPMSHLILHQISVSSSCHSVVHVTMMVFFPWRPSFIIEVPLLLTGSTLTGTNSHDNFVAETLLFCDCKINKYFQN